MIPFGTQTKQMAFGIWLAGPNQIRPNEISTFGTKTNQMHLVIGWTKRTLTLPESLLKVPVEMVLVGGC